MFPLVSCEIPDFDIDRAVNNGMLPTHYPAARPSARMSAYVDVYLKEEIKAESLVRNLSLFQRFLEVAAITSGEIVNYNNIAADCGVAAATAREYFAILEDSLVGYMLPSYRKEMKRRLVHAPRFYFFDNGIVNHLLRRKELRRGTTEYGHAFEHLIMQELRAYIAYTSGTEQLSYWRTYTGLEVDAVVGEARVAIEIKSVEEVQQRHLKGLKAFSDEYPQSRRIVVSLDPLTRTIGSVEAMYAYDFLKSLWRGEIL
jgi:predicted AAA+ superfamily ATPase